MKRLFVLTGLVLALGLYLPTYAQIDTATLVGSVRDTTGAVIPNATITVTNLDTQIAQTTHTDSQGNYVVTPLRIGRYSVAAQAQGFKTETRSDIVLRVQDRIAIDFTLQVGNVTQVINVSGEAPLVQTESSSLGDVIGGTQVTEMPLNGRDYTQLATLTTGVTKVYEGPQHGGNTPTNGNVGGVFVVNGTRGNLNNFMLDGIDNNSNDDASNVLRTNVDAIAEFKVQTSTYSAEFGRSGGAVINATIRSGTNSFHGDVFEFLRNQALDARGFFEPSDQPKAPYKQNQFGGTIGGPIRKDKTFFFGDYQGTRIHSANTWISTVPTPEEHLGDFSALLGAQVGTDALGRPVYDGEIFNPATTRTVGGATVRDGFGFDPTTGLPIPGAANVIPSDGINAISKAYDDLYPAPSQSGLANNYVINAPATDRIDQFDTRVDHYISSKSQFFARFSLSQRTRFVEPRLPGLADGGGYSTGKYLEGTRGASLGYTYTVTPTVVNELRLGFNRIKYDDNIPAYGQNYPTGDLVVPGVPNNPATNGLTLFQPNGYRSLGEPGFTPTLITSQEFQLYDTLNIVRGKHTIRLGPQFHRSQFNIFQVAQPRGRFQFSGQFTMDNPNNPLVSGNGLADMLLGLSNYAAISTLTNIGNRQHIYGGFVQDDYKVTPNLTLNLGLRYDYTTPIMEAHNRQSNFDFKTGQIIPAATKGYSRGLVSTDLADFAPRVGFAYSPFKNHKTVFRVGYGRFFSYQEIRTGDPLQLGYNLPFFFEPSFVSDGITPVLTVAEGFPPLDISQAQFAGVTANDWQLRAPVFDEWNLNIQHELPGDVLLEVAYVGSKGTHLQVLADRNQDPTPGPGDVQARRPYPQYGPFTSIEDHGNSTFHSFQLKTTKRFSHGLYFLSAFTYSKSMNDQPEICCSSPWPQDSYNLKAEKGPSDFDSRFRWVSSFDYVLPFGRGQRFLANGARALDLLFRGWHFDGIITFRSGFYFSPLMGYDPSNTGSIGLVRTDRLANGNLPPSQRTPDLWFDINAFPVPSGLSFGNAGKNILIGPGEKEADLSIRKVFDITERQKLEFRAEFFNAFNHPVFAMPDNYITDGPGAAGVSTETVLPQRQIQFALKYRF
jgi:hypothetical protein